MVQFRLLSAAAFLLVPTQLVSAQAPPTPATAAPAVSAASAPAYTSDTKFVKAMHDGRVYLRQHHSEFAVDQFNKANKIAGGSCSECVQGLYDSYVDDQDFKRAIASAEQLDELAKSSMDKSVAEYERGMALYRKGGTKPKPDQLQAAHDALQQALTSFPTNAAALYLDGQVLARMGRMDEASASFRKCISCARPNDPSRLRAEHFAEDPSLSLKRMAPAFVVTALDGSRFNLDAMGGRVVLIDFWATWCGPCNEELPEMKRIAKEFAGQPLVILSVSWDDDAATWKAFIQKNEMTWMQYRDADKALTREFGVEAIPHYFTIDSDGVLTSEMVGSGSDVEGRLKKLLAKARESQKERGTMQQAAGGS